MEQVSVVLILVAIIVVQQILFTVAIHKFANKLMSRNYVEYSQVTSKQAPVEARVRIEPEDVPEDMRTLNGL